MLDKIEQVILEVIISTQKLAKVHVWKIFSSNHNSPYIILTTISQTTTGFEQ